MIGMALMKESKKSLKFFYQGADNNDDYGGEYLQIRRNKATV